MSSAAITWRDFIRAILSMLAVVALMLGLTLSNSASAAPAPHKSALTSFTLSPDAVTQTRVIIMPDEIVAAHLASYRTVTQTTRTDIVKRGDTLSSIAQRFYGKSSLWPCVWDANKAKVPNPNMISIGLELLVPTKLKLTGCSAPVITTTALSTDGDTSYGSTPRYAVVTARYISASYGSVNPADYSGFQACVVTRESGGRSQVMNSSGHYGLYQFSASTWAAAGGNPNDFGHASVAEQNQVFATAYARFGTSPWAPYDGC